MREKIAQGVKLKNHAMLGFRKVPKGKNCKRVSVFWRFVGCSPSGENSESVFRPRGAKDSVSFEYPYIIAKKCRVVNRQSDCS